MYVMINIEWLMYVNRLQLKYLFPTFETKRWKLTILQALKIVPFNPGSKLAFELHDEKTTQYQPLTSFWRQAEHLKRY